MYSKLLAHGLSAKTPPNPVGINPKGAKRQKTDEKLQMNRANHQY